MTIIYRVRLYRDYFPISLIPSSDRLIVLFAPCHQVMRCMETGDAPLLCSLCTAGACIIRWHVKQCNLR